MKGIKFVLPVMGVFLVLYVALVMLNSAKMNGIVSKLNKEYDEEFIIIGSTIGNVFTDDDFEVTARSETTGRLYEFHYQGGTITGEYEEEERMIDLGAYIEEQVDNEVIVIPQMEKLSIMGSSLKDTQFSKLQIFALTKTAGVKKSIEEVLKELYPNASNIEVIEYEMSEEQLQKLQSELLGNVPYSKIQQDYIESYIK